MGSRTSRVSHMAFLTWLFALSTTAFVVFAMPPSGDVDLLIHELGLIFAAYALGARAIACALHDWGTMVMAILGVTFGLWFPYLNQNGSPHMMSALAMLPGMTEGLLLALEFPAVVISAGAITGAASYLVMRSGTVFVNVMLLSVVAAGMTAIPLDEVMMLRLAVIVWHAGVAATMCRWAVSAAKRAQGLACPFCGSDLVGLTSPVCTSCKHKLPTMCKLPSPGRRAA